MISANGGLPAHRYTPQVTQRWPRGSEPASVCGHFSGLWVSFEKMYVIIKGIPVERQPHSLAGLKDQRSGKCLGVQLGNSRRLH